MKLEDESQTRHDESQMLAVNRTCERSWSNAQLRILKTVMGLMIVVTMIAHLNNS